MLPRDETICGPLDSFPYAPKLLPYSEGSCHLDPGYCGVRGLGDDLGAASIPDPAAFAMTDSIQGTYCGDANMLRRFTTRRDCRSGQRATVACSTSRWYIENRQSAFLRPLMPAPQP